MRQLEREEVWREVAGRVRARWGLDAPGGLCLYYAVETVRGIRSRGVRAIVQAGTAQWPVVRPDQDDGVRPTHFGYVWSPQRRASREAVRAGRLPEMHVWAGIPSTGEIVDLAAGEFVRLAAAAGVEWPGDPPPPYVWASAPPDRVIYRPHHEAVEMVLKLVAKEQGRAAAVGLVA